MNEFPRPRAERSHADILSVSPIAADHAELSGILRDAQQKDEQAPKWRIWDAVTVPAALDLASRIEFPVVVVERDIPEGAWKGLLHGAQRLANPPLIVVTSLHADEYLWAEALNLGAHDVLAKPFDPAEVTRTIRLAYDRWQWQHGSAPARGIAPRPVVKPEPEVASHVSEHPRRRPGARQSNPTMTLAEPEGKMVLSMFAPSGRAF